MIEGSYAYQYMDSDLDASDYRIELGYGPFGTMVRGTIFDEDKPQDTLQLLQIAFLYRITAGEDFEFDLGIGPYVMKGEDGTAGMTITVPVSFHPKDVVGLEFKPSYIQFDKNNFWDMDVEILGGWRYFSLGIGYRRLIAQAEKIQNIYFGASVRD